MDKKQIRKAVKLLMDKQLSISFAESMSAGKMASTFCSIHGSWDILKWGIVAYRPDIKQKLLGVKKWTLEKYTAESAECTREMVEGLQNLFGTDICIAITWLASAWGSETKEKPVGSIFIAIMIHDTLYEYKKLFRWTAVGIINKSIAFTAQELCKKLA